MSGLEISRAWDTEQVGKVTRLVDDYDSLLPWRRKAARRALEQMGDEAVPPLLALFAQENSLHAAHLRKIGPMLLFGLIASALLLIINRIGERSEVLSAFASSTLIVMAGG